MTPTAEHIYNALNERRKDYEEENGKIYHYLNDQTIFSKAAQDLLYAIDSWHSEQSHLFSIDNWRVNNLIGENGRVRKPSVCLNVEITSKDNLVVEWYPNISNAGSGCYVVTDLEKSDFLSWSNAIHFYKPENRLFMIHSFLILADPDKVENKINPLPALYLLQAVKAHIEQIISCLSNSFDVILHNDLYLTFDRIYPKLNDHIIFGSSGIDPNLEKYAEIRNVAEENERKKRQLKEAWLEKTFKDEMGISVEEFLIIWEKQEHVYAKTSRALSDVGSKASPEKVKRLVHRLYGEYQALYNKYCTKITSGYKKTIAGQIIPFKAK